MLLDRGIIRGQSLSWIWIASAWRVLCRGTNYIELTIWSKSLSVILIEWSDSNWDRFSATLSSCLNWTTFLLSCLEGSKSVDISAKILLISHPSRFSQYLWFDLSESLRASEPFHELLALWSRDQVPWRGRRLPTRWLIHFRPYCLTIFVGFFWTGMEWQIHHMWHEDHSCMIIFFPFVIFYTPFSFLNIVDTFPRFALVYHTTVLFFLYPFPFVFRNFLHFFFGHFSWLPFLASFLFSFSMSVFHVSLCSAIFIFSLSTISIRIFKSFVFFFALLFRHLFLWAFTFSGLFFFQVFTFCILLFGSTNGMVREVLRSQNLWVDSFFTIACLPIGPLELAQQTNRACSAIHWWPWLFCHHLPGKIKRDWLNLGISTPQAL